jgi:hypothetical protein
MGFEVPAGGIEDDEVSRLPSGFHAVTLLVVFQPPLFAEPGKTSGGSDDE